MVRVDSCTALDSAVISARVVLAYALRGLAGVRESVGELVRGLTPLNRALVGGVHSALLSTANGLSISCAAGGAGRLRLTSCCGIWSSLTLLGFLLRRTSVGKVRIATCVPNQFS